MVYEGDVYRPPSEADSLIIQVTIGCAHNDCTFCKMYKAKKFRIRKQEEILADLKEISESPYVKYIRRVFLADGDALIVPAARLVEILDAVSKWYPNVTRTTAYGTASDVMLKTDEELKELKAHGLEMVYIGAESGDDGILKAVKKDASAGEMAVAVRRLEEAGIMTSVTFISGLGGQPLMERHASSCARLVSEMKPSYASFLTLQLHPETQMYEDVRSGAFKRITTEESVREMEIFLSEVDSEGTVFRMNHASNCFRLAGTLNGDIPAMQRVLSEVRSGERFARAMGEIEII